MMASKDEQEKHHLEQLRHTLNMTISKTKLLLDELVGMMYDNTCDVKLLSHNEFPQMGPEVKNFLLEFISVQKSIQQRIEECIHHYLLDESIKREEPSSSSENLDEDGSCDLVANCKIAPKHHSHQVEEDSFGDEITSKQTKLIHNEGVNYNGRGADKITEICHPGGKDENALSYLVATPVFLATDYPIEVYISAIGPFNLIWIQIPGSDVNKMTEYLKENDVKVCYIDSGGIGMVSIENLHPLPTHIAELSDMTVCCTIKQIDDEFVSTHQSGSQPDSCEKLKYYHLEPNMPVKAILKRSEHYSDVKWSAEDYIKFPRYDICICSKFYDNADDTLDVQHTVKNSKDTDHIQLNNLPEINMVDNKPTNNHKTPVNSVIYESDTGLEDAFTRINGQPGGGQTKAEQDTQEQESNITGAASLTLQEHSTYDVDTYGSLTEMPVTQENLNSQVLTVKSESGSET
ncbi:putative Tudor domain-containing protein, partial [Homarus americanus]